MSIYGLKLLFYEPEVIMYEKIEIESSLEGLAAYEYPCENPEYIMCTIHGIGEHFGRYERMAGMLEKYNIKMIGMDLRGHGNTPGKRGHCAPRKEVLADIDALIKYAVNTYTGIPIILYGHSMGGNIVFDYRYRGKFAGVPKGYVISAPWIKLVRPVTGIMLVGAKILAKIAPTFTISSVIDEKILGNPKSVGAYSRDPLVHSRISSLTAVEGFTLGNKIFDGSLMGKGEGRERPLLLMHGNSDKICDVEGSRQAAKNEGDICEYVEWDGYYHEIHNGGPDADGSEVIEKIGNWIKETV